MLRFAVVLQVVWICLATLNGLPIVYSQCGEGNTTRPLELTGEGQLSSPNYPDPYYDYADCQWRITSTNQTVAVKFQNFSTEIYDIVHIYDGSNNMSTQIAQLAGGYPEGYLDDVVFQTTQPEMFIRFTSDGSVNLQGFVATFWSTTVAPQCASSLFPETLTGSGQLSSPFYPDYYTNDADCNWRLIANDFQVIMLTFSAIALDTQSCCDFIMLYDGYYNSAWLIAQLSGTFGSPIESYYSSQVYMFVNFRTDSSFTASGFNATFQSTYGGGIPDNTVTAPPNGTPTSSAAPGNGAQCPWYPVELTGYNGTFESPNFPYYYPVNMNCQWRITSTAQAVDLSFSYFVTDSCCDFVLVYDGASDASPQIASLAGSYNPPPSGILTTQQFMYIRFTSDRSITYQGFQATYTSVNGDACSASSRPLILTDGSGTFVSANYPGQYNNNSDCQWQIISQLTDGLVSLQFNDFDTEACCDVLTVYDGTSIKDPVIAVLSGTYFDLPRRYNSTQRNMFILFQTDSSVTARGFSAQYSSIGAGACSSDSDPLEVTGFTGTLQSPNYPANYYNDATCQWLITSVYFKGFVTLNFEFFQTEACCDKLTIFDGDSNKSPKLTVLSGSHEPAPGNLTTTQRVMLVRFVTDTTVTDVGFSATFTSAEPIVTACGSVLLLTPNGTTADVGWGPVCYITVNQPALLNVPCRDLIQDLPPDIGDYSSLLSQGGNFGCGASARNDFIGSDFVCQDNYNQGLTLASAPSANKMLVCIRLPPTFAN